ncbi:CMGC family protein kinase [Tritrichomonas foetus]|uniref:CMGC family protein kinase n=1 Tax=Tritrichomonas foetus TaxID=1144522 RepID=A0A1J4KSS1_9EUKA|nr:CMGC family protein kinase [Tritrichomonas foetus]|eukprot:OHT14343.1 CMGC family protein kinase [Tritrichomonas foetus]
MKRFDVIEVLGDGAFGIVTKCRDKETGELVAIKKMKQKYESFDECLKLKEVKSLRKIKHNNVIKLLQVFREDSYLFLVFELLGKSLLKTMNEKNGQAFSEDEIRNIMHQLLVGLSYVHRQGFFHRDIKPENLLWKDDVLKLADFGLAREIRSRPPYTEYVSTRWYRAPEIILRSPNYNSPVDIWAVGAIMAELYLGHPIFQGLSEQDQMYKIVNVLGTPNSQNWPDFGRLVSKTPFRIPPMASVPLSSMMLAASPEAIDLITQLLSYDPARRPSASQALNHPFFSRCEKPPAGLSSRRPQNEQDSDSLTHEKQHDSDSEAKPKKQILQPVVSGRQGGAKSALNKPTKDLLEQDSTLTNDLDDILNQLL